MCAIIWHVYVYTSDLFGCRYSLEKLVCTSSFCATGNIAFCGDISAERF